MSDVAWRTSLEDAREQARREQRLVLIDLFNPR